MIDLSDRPSLRSLDRLLDTVRVAAREVSVLVVGAAARDLLLVHAHGIAVQRATEDTDVALAVPGWDRFLRVRKTLLDSEEFLPDRNRQHRLWYGDEALDLIPFGGVERRDRSIAWPPDGAEVMNVSGFQEALATAVAVRLPGGSAVNVASLPALALLKLWAWQDRKYTAREKDAADLWVLLRHYAEAGNEDRLYDSEVEVLTASGFDLEQAGARLLGKDAARVLANGPEPQRSLEAIAAVLRPEIEPDGALQLLGQMPPGDRNRQLALLIAFQAGLLRTGP